MASGLDQFRLAAMQGSIQCHAHLWTKGTIHQSGQLALSCIDRVVNDVCASSLPSAAASPAPTTFCWTYSQRMPG
jgi:hypothetical protein